MSDGKKIEWTERQKAVIGYDGGDLIVSASAGSGKTTVMLARVMRLIGEGHSLKNMLISTFTVSAANDMRAKLAVKLREEYERTGNERFMKEAEGLGSADICTLHKWCQKLIRKYFYVCGDDPAFEIADDKESGAWLNESVERALADEEKAPDEAYADLCACYIRKRSTLPIKRMITEMLYFAFSQTDDEAWLKNASSGYRDERACREVTDAATERRFRRALDSVTEFEMLAADCGLTEKAAPYVAEMHAMLSGGEVQWSRAVGISPLLPARNLVKKYVAAYHSFVDELASVRDDVAAVTSDKLCSIALRAREYYNAVKEEKGKLDFSDLERRARRILESEEGDVIRASLDYVFIDEYQDINPLQESIIALLGKDNLFFVGDVKQNIYAFRNCTPKAFNEKFERLTERGGSMELNRNYRSKEGILRFCNVLFSRIMTRGFGMVDYKKSSAFTVGDDPENDGSVEIFRYRKEKRASETAGFDNVYSVRDDIPTDAEDSDEEADAITRYIVGLIRNEGYKYDDIAVLTRSRFSGEEKVARNLRALGIPVSVGSKLNVTEGRINKLLIAMLRLADNMYDDLSLVTVMRSPVGGFTDDELTAMRAAMPDAEYFYECVSACAERDADGKAARFTEKMTEYARLARITGVGELAGRMTSENKLFATALGERSGIAKADALGRLLEAANGFGGSLSEFLEQIGSDYATEAEVSGQPGSVVVMTVHASKGLEFPVVVMCGLTRNFRNEVSTAVYDGELGLGMEARVRETGEKFPSLPLIAIKEKKQKENREEEMRILYVALTRAKERLALFLPDDMSDEVRPPDECKNFAEWIYPTAVAHGICDQPMFDAEEESKETACETDEKYARRIRDYLAALPPSDAHDIKRSVTGLLADIEPSEDAAEQTFSLTGAEYEGADAREAMKRGTAYHAALERADFSLTYDEQKDILASSPDFGLTDPNKLAAALDALKTQTEGAVLYREQPFLMTSDKSVNGECDGLLVQGVIDLMAVRGNDCEIIDYKTGRLTAERKVKYNRQLDIYAAAAEKLLGLKITRKMIYLIDEKRFMN